MASRKLILSSLRLSSSSPHGYLFNRVTEYCSAAADPPPQTPGKKDLNIIQEHEHEHEHKKGGVGYRCRCIPMSRLIARLKRKTGRDDIDMDYIVAEMDREDQLFSDISRKVNELREKEFGSDVKKNDKLLRETMTTMFKEYDNNNKD